MAEFLHATAASIPVPPASSAKKRDREGAELPSPPTPPNTVGETLPDIPPAAEAARNAASPSPTTSDFTSAAVPCDLHGAALHGPESSGEPPSGVTPHSAASHGPVSSGDTPHGAAPHGAASHGAAPVPSDTATSSSSQHPDPPCTNIFQHEPWYPATDHIPGTLPPGINPLTGAVFNPHTDLPAHPLVLHGHTSGWRPVRRDEWGDELSDDGW